MVPMRERQAPCMLVTAGASGKNTDCGKLRFFHKSEMCNPNYQNPSPNFLYLIVPFVLCPSLPLKSGENLLLSVSRKATNLTEMNFFNKNSKT